MSNFRITYDNPWLLLLIIPALLLTLIPYFRLEKKYRFTRNKIISMTLHIAAMVLAVNLLAGLGFSYEIPNEDNEVILLVDSSDSLESEREERDRLVESVVSVLPDDCKIGVVKFGWGCDYSVALTKDKERVIAEYLAAEETNSTATALADAIKYAAGLFTNKKTSKIVIISDGLETDGEAALALNSVLTEGTRIDAMPLASTDKKDVQIISAEIEDKTIVANESFNLNLVIKCNSLTAERPAVLRLYDNGEIYGETVIALENGESSFPVSLSVSSRGMHELTFEILTEHELYSEPIPDGVKENNSYRTFVNLQKFENVLLIEGYAGEGDKLAQILSENKKNVERICADGGSFPASLTDMAKYEEIILVNVAYSDMPVGFEERLHRYVYELGGGLFTVGGRLDSEGDKKIPHAYNREDIESSVYLKQMLPIKTVEYTPPIAVMIVVDTSTSMKSNGKLEAAADGALACLDALADRDYCGVMSFSGSASEKLSVLPVSRRDEISDAIIKLKDNEGGSTVFSGAISKAGGALSVIDNVDRKHIIFVTDALPGDSYSQYEYYIKSNAKKGITMSIVTVGSSEGNSLDMLNAAAAGGGSYYNVQTAGELAQIMKKDLSSKAIAEVVYNKEVTLKAEEKSHILAGIDEKYIPKLTGYYGTVAKKDARVILSGDFVPIYSYREYGKGTVGSFMCDIGGECSKAFASDLVGKTIIINIVDSLFPSEDVRADSVRCELNSDNYSTWLNVHGIPKGFKAEVTVLPISAHIQHLSGAISVVAAEANSRFTFNIIEPGLYRVTLTVYDSDGAVYLELPMYRTLSYSEEYDTLGKDAEDGMRLLASLAREGRGVVISDPVDAFSGFSKTIEREYDPASVMIIAAIICVVLDIAVRKFKFKWIHELIKERRAENE